MSNLARNSQDMFIVQEHTPTANSINNASDEGKTTYPKINSHQDLKGYAAKNNVIGLSPVINSKKQPSGNNLIKS